MIIVTNVKIGQAIAKCENLIETGSDRLVKRKHIQQGINEIQQALGGLEVIKDLVGTSQDVKSFQVNY